MSEYTPTTAEVREEFVYGHQEVDMRGNVVVSFDEANVRWDRWLAEVERAAAEKALTDAAKDWRKYTHTAPTSAPCAEWWLNRRAAALGLTAGQEGENE